jgi:hypothetical protein
VNSLRPLDLPPSVWANLAERIGTAGLRLLNRLVRENDLDVWDVAEAIYWLAADYGASEHDPLRKAANCTEYNPGRLHRAPTTDGSRLIYEQLGKIL